MHNGVIPFRRVTLPTTQICMRTFPGRVGESIMKLNPAEEPTGPSKITNKIHNFCRAIQEDVGSKQPWSLHHEIGEYVRIL